MYDSVSSSSSAVLAIVPYQPKDQTVDISDTMTSGSNPSHYSDLDTTPTPSDEENQSYSARVPRSDPKCLLMDFEGLDMDRPSTVAQAELDSLRNSFAIPEDVYFNLPQNGDRASRPTGSQVAVCAAFFDLGLRFPIQGYFAKILAAFNLAPCQLNLNGRRVLAGLYVIWERAGLGEPTLDELKRLYRLNANPKEHKGWYYLSSYAKNKSIVTKLRTTNKHFKDKWFWIGGLWGWEQTHQGQNIMVPNTFASGACWGDQPKVDHATQDRIRQAF